MKFWKAHIYRKRKNSQSATLKQHNLTLLLKRTGRPIVRKYHDLLRISNREIPFRLLARYYNSNRAFWSFSGVSGLLPLHCFNGSTNNLYSNWEYRTVNEQCPFEGLNPIKSSSSRTRLQSECMHLSNSGGIESTDIVNGSPTFGNLIPPSVPLCFHPSTSSISYQLWPLRAVNNWPSLMRISSHIMGPEIKSWSKKNLSWGVWAFLLTSPYESLGLVLLSRSERRDRCLTRGKKLSWNRAANWFVHMVSLYNFEKKISINSMRIFVYFASFKIFMPLFTIFTYSNPIPLLDQPHCQTSFWWTRFSIHSITICLNQCN